MDGPHLEVGGPMKCDPHHGMAYIRRLGDHRQSTDSTRMTQGRHPGKTFADHIRMPDHRRAAVGCDRRPVNDRRLVNERPQLLHRRARPITKATLPAGQVITVQSQQDISKVIKDLSTQLAECRLHLQKRPMVQPNSLRNISRGNPSRSWK